jgi:Zn-dependent protease
MLLQLLFSEPLLFAVVLIAIIVALTIHEYAHGMTAYLLGDPTAERQGRLSLNPLVHLDPIGFLMMLLAGFGYARPVPYNPNNLRNRRRDPVLVGLAGPFSNLVLAGIGAYAALFFQKTLGGSNLLVQFLAFLAYINVNLAVFNLLPIPPLDGSSLLLAALHAPKWAHLRAVLVQQGPMILIAAIIVDSVSGIGFFSRIFSFFGNAFFALIGVAL